MHLTVYTDYSLRLLMFLALKDNALATISEIAASYRISKNHLTKVAYELGVAGYVETVRGRSGGLRLAKPMASIRIGDVVRQTEPDLGIVQCFKPAEIDCAILPGCVLRKALDRAQKAFFEVLDGYTLDDLVAPQSRLRSLLAIAPPKAKAS